MTNANGTSRRPLRLWPGVVLLTLQWLGFFLPLVLPATGFIGMMVAAGCGVLIVLWWLLFSRAPWLERIAAVALMPLATIAATRIVDRSIENAGMGKMVYFLVIPFLCLGLVLWAAASRRLSTAPRLASLAVALLLGGSLLATIRTGGVNGGGRSDLHWRWTPTPEERLLAQAAHEPTPAPRPRPTPETKTESPAAERPATKAIAAPAKPAVKAAAAAPTPEPSAAPPPEWPGFRGGERDSVVHGARIRTDWSASPPVQIWRRPIGPGWSSFAVQGELVYTQEQRGEDEIVACYRLGSGEPVWLHKDKARFWESNGGPGPRGTPTLAGGRVYALGATGILNALDAATGAVFWSRNAVADTGAKIPGWGIASSPLVVGDLLVVAASGRLAAYGIATGEPRWYHPTKGGSYSSPQLMTIAGVPQILLLSGSGATSVAPADGSLLWEHAWEGAAMLQPARASEDDVLVTSGDMMGGMGTKRLAVAHGPSGWTASERWLSKGLKPYYNDLVVHKGYAYGFDGNILSCIDLADGARKWKGGRYGNGQLVLLEDQDLLLVVSEEGELVLVKAAPDQFQELAKVPAIDGKTWNHPVLVGDVVLVRNGQEMAAFRLARAGS